MFVGRAGTDHMLEQKQDMHAMIQDATPERMGLMLEVFQNMMMSTGKTSRFGNGDNYNSVLLHATT